MAKPPKDFPKLSAEPLQVKRRRRAMTDLEVGVMARVLEIPVEALDTNWHLEGWTGRKHEL